MTENNLNYILQVIKGIMPAKKPNDWYTVMGFLRCHRIEGLFYNRSLNLKMQMPFKAEKELFDVFYKQKRRVEFLRKEIAEISESLKIADAKHIFLKGSVLSNLGGDYSIYVDGERSSNDIDILVKEDEISSVSKALLNKGYMYGIYDRKENVLRTFTRFEILLRRMNRGETAPLVKMTGNPEIPYIEVDLNFSLGNVPGEHADLLTEMIDTREWYEGKIGLYSANKEMFFTHLILHQYKECCLYFSAERGKDLDLYKLADIYYIWKSGRLNLQSLEKIIQKYNLQKEAGAVFMQVGAVFKDAEFLDLAERYGAEQPEVIDYGARKKYEWITDLSHRVRRIDGVKCLRRKRDV